MTSFSGWISLGCLVALTACSSAGPSAIEASGTGTIVLGHEWRNAPWRGFGGLDAWLLPFDPATGRAGKGAIAGQGQMRVNIRRPDAEGTNFDAFPVVPGSYVLGHYEVDAGDLKIEFFCPARLIEVRAGEVVYPGNLIFDRGTFTGFTRSDPEMNAFLARQPELSASAASYREPLAVEIDYSKYQNPGFINWRGQTPCSGTTVGSVSDRMDEPFANTMERTG